MRSRILGNALILAGGALFAALAYEPANVSAALGLERTLSEAVVVLAGLTVSAACGAAGVAMLVLARDPSLKTGDRCPS